MIRHDLLWSLGMNALLWAWVWLVPPILLRVRYLPMGGRGMALPGMILLLQAGAECGPGEDEIIRHELVHQQQLRRYSPLGAALLLGWYYGRGFLRHRWMDRAIFLRLWPGNPLEIEANAAMDRQAPLPKVWDWRG